MIKQPNPAEVDRLPPAVVLQLDCMTGLQTARILARKGIRVIGVAEDQSHYACKSRFVDEVLNGDPPRLVETLDRVASLVAGPYFVIPCSDRFVSALIACRSQLPITARFVQPDISIAEVLMDKARFAEFAASAGLPVPVTRRLTHRSATHVSGTLRFPVVVKPALKTRAWEEGMGGKVVVVSNEDELQRTIEQGLLLAEEIVVQQWIPGGDSQLVSFNGYFDRTGTPRATFTARKLRQWPPHAGTSASGEEVRSDETLDLAIRLFTEVGFRGLAYLETKIDPATGDPTIIEPNIGRPTGRSAIAEAGGVELVYAAYRDALDLHPLPVEQQKFEGVKWVYLRHEIQSAVSAIVDGELTVRQWVRSLRGRKAYAVWAKDDPGPFFWDLLASALRSLRRLPRYLAR